jgi:3-oxoacyl-[acyl-carrier-protein] synthase II
MMGHSLGAAGAIEAAVCLLALQHQFLPANINFTAPDDDVELNVIANEARPAAASMTLSNSFGFGGTNASLIMRKFPPSPGLQQTRGA